jgi:hypothetical protein
MWWTVYLCGAILMSAAAWSMANRLADRDPVQSFTQISVALLVGAAWPLALLGLVQMLVVKVALDRMRANHRTDVETGTRPEEILAAVSY